MNPDNVDLAAIAEQAFDKLDTPEVKEEVINEEQKEENTNSEPKEVEENKEADKSDTKDESLSEDGAKEEVESDEPEGYFADEGLEEVEPEDIEQPTGELTGLGKFLTDNLPTIQVVGTSNGKQVTVNVKRAEDLPDDFEFQNKKSEKIFDQSIADQTTRAYQLAQAYQNQENQQAQSKLSEQENREIQLDIADLQRNGDLPRYRFASDDPKFETDPSVVETQKVLDFYNKENQRRYQEAQNNGRMPSRISFKDAYRLYYLDNPKTTPEQKAEDKSRKQVSSKITGNRQGATSNTSQSSRLPWDISIDRLIESIDI